MLFDFDGVLADTENVHVAAWERTFDQMGLEVAADVCACAAEIDDRAFLAEVLQSHEIDQADDEGWLKRKQDLTLALLGDTPRLYPGVVPLIAHLRGRVHLAVVSGTWRENVVCVLNAAGLADAFALILGKKDVEAVKPAPDVYRLALKRLGVKAASAVALEDSPTGLEAARAAGVRAVAVGHRRSQGDWTQGHPFVVDLRDADAVLDALALG